MGQPNEVLNISTADLKEAAPVFGKQSEALAEAVGRLTNRLETLGLPWGSDAPGTEFGDLYGPRRRTLESAVEILATGLASVHHAMSDMADGHIDNEENIKGVFADEDPVPGSLSAALGAGGERIGPAAVQRATGGAGLHQS
ncbi:WXG100 family type VII secretion target [Streptomyces albidus (ex Kaewkla and Franco 2022)]|uniref:WXG100 family type VII secretion target n=1 Tax=Streptomyces albidus (ex Kaewkla and Franco 2022) TaxID=722709 RepID=UPI0015EEF43F|nr:hypothetical protein [Streptomyces albidus (ex Kaewkla and Franco 2022)]